MRRTSSKPKIFFLGFNKCGTKTFHHFFEKNGLRSSHHARKTRIFGKTFNKTKVAGIIQRNVIAGRNSLRGLRHYDVFSDMNEVTEHGFIEAARYFPHFAQDYPDAYFIFNDRPLERWIASRLGHVNGPYGDFPGRYASALGVAREDLPEIWTRQYAHHKAEVFQFFKGHPRFLHFDIIRDGPEEMRAFLAPDYALDARHWKHRGSAAERAERFSRTK